jgi:hypothetical protein
VCHGILNFNTTLKKAFIRLMSQTVPFSVMSKSKARPIASVSVFARRPLGLLDFRRIQLKVRA